MLHHTQLLINLRAFENNLHVLRRHIRKNSRFCIVLKADAYGHGLDLLAPIAAKFGAAYIAFVDNWEACRIRDLGISTNLIRLRPALADEMEEALAWRVEEIVGTFDQARFLSRLGIKYQKIIPVHIKLDVGMGRSGFLFEHQQETIRQILQMPAIRVVGIMTHYSNTDDENDLITLRQWKDFESQSHRLRPELTSDVIYHSSNSAAALRFCDIHDDMVRVGIASYGLTPSPFIKERLSLTPVMKWITRIVQIRDMPRHSTVGYGMTHRLNANSKIAAIPVGYADGYFRTLSNRMDVLVRGTRCPVIGRISMDLTTIDISHLNHADLGDEVVLLGKQGNEIISAEEFAKKIGTIHYEITCMIGKANRQWRQPVL